MKNIMRSPMRMALAGATAFALLAIGQAQAVTVGPGAFSYSYNSQNATGTGTPDPNAVLSNVRFLQEGPPNYVNAYTIDDLNNPNPNASSGTITYTFDASAGQVFSGSASVFDRVNIFGFSGNVLVQSSLDGGAFSTIGALRTGATPEYQTNMFNVDGAQQVVLKYNLFSISPSSQPNNTQVFRQANVNLGGLEQTPFVFSGETRAIPEPTSIVLMGLAGLTGLSIARRRRTEAR